MKLVIGLLKKVILSFVKALKVNMGINGQVLEYDHGGMMGYVPVGIDDGFFWNTIISFILFFLGVLPPVCVLFPYVYLFIFGFFIFPRVKDLLGIEFPPDDKFHLPQRTR